MMSLRSFARAAPRAISRLSAPAIRTSSRTSSLLVKTPIVPSTLRAAAFSTSVFRRAPAGETDAELSAKLESEIGFESEVKESEAEPTSIKDFLANGPFELKDTPGQESVVLTRTFGNEKITVTFSIADLANYDQDMYNEDPALADEDGLENTSGSNPAADGRQGEQAQEGEDEFDDAEDPGVPCRLTIVVEKPGHGALNVEATAQLGRITVENLFFFKDAELAHAVNAEVQHKAQNVYPGPPFGTLDEDLQILMERYLEERGITSELATFVPDYMDSKEQKEYLTWLSNIKGFIDA